MNEGFGSLIFLFLFMLLVTGVAFYSESERTETIDLVNNTLIEDYANASYIQYDPIKKTYTFGKHVNVSKEDLIKEPLN